MLAFDFLGFGDSDKPADHDYTMHEQADLDRGALAAARREAHRLVVHDYGVSVAQELLARHAEGRLGVEITRVIFLNGGLYPELHRPQPAQLMLLDPEQGPKLGHLHGRGDVRPWPPRHLRAGAPADAATSSRAWLAVSRRDGHRIGHRLIQYIPDRERHRDRWVGRARDTAVPRHFLWGDLDPVSGAHMADRIAERLPAPTSCASPTSATGRSSRRPTAVAQHLERILEMDVE